MAIGLEPPGLLAHPCRVDLVAADRDVQVGHDLQQRRPVVSDLGRQARQRSGRIGQVPRCRHPPRQLSPGRRASQMVVEVDTQRPGSRSHVVPRHRCPPLRLFPLCLRLAAPYVSREDLRFGARGRPFFRMGRASVRDMIFEAGRAEFHEHGYTATGIAAITARAKAHKGSFYNHFASKEELAVEALGAYAASQRLEMLADPKLTPADRLRAHFAFLADQIAGAPVINGCMVANFAAESSGETPLIREQITAIYGLWSRQIAATLQEAADSAGVTNVDAQASALALLDSYEGAALRARAAGSGGPLQNFLRTTLPLFLSAVSGTH